MTKTNVGGLPHGSYIVTDNSAVIAVLNERIAELEKALQRQVKRVKLLEPLLESEPVAQSVRDLEQQKKVIDILYKAGKCDADCLKYFKALTEQGK